MPNFVKEAISFLFLSTFKNNNVKNIISFVFCFLSLAAFSQLTPTLWQINNTSIIEWYYHFGDEFTGQKIDDNKWYENYPWGGLSIKDGIYAAPENIRTENGKAFLKVDTSSSFRTFPSWMLEEEIKKNNPLVQNNSVKLNYVTAALWSKLQFKYGYFECRCFIPAGQGLWPAFWLYGGKPNDEIDFMESKGEKKNEFHVDIHCPDECDKIRTPPFFLKKPWGSWLKTDRSLMGEWVVFSGIWLPGYVNFYMNGRPVANYQGDFSAEMNMIANISVAVDNGPFSPGPNKKTMFPSEFVVDYMRVWKINTEETPSSTHQGRFTEGKLMNRSTTNDEDIANKKLGPIFALEGTEKANLKRKNRRTLPKKPLNFHQGFVSLMPVSDQVYQLHLNGIVGPEVKIEVINEIGEVVKSFNVKEKYHFISLDDFQAGNYNLVISNGANLKQQISFTKP